MGQTTRTTRQRSRTGARRRWLAVPLAAALIASVVAPTAATAQAAPGGDPAASTVVRGLLRLSSALGAAAEQPALGEALPLTDVSLRDALGLERAIGEAVSDAVQGQSYDLDSLPALVSASSELDLVEDTSVAAPLREWDLGITLAEAVPVPLTYDDGRLRFGAGELTGELAATLDGALRLRYDPRELALRQFSVVDEALLTVRGWTRPVGGGAAASTLPMPAFPVVDGFVELQAQGDMTVDTTTVLRVREPNGRTLTTEDLLFGEPTELFAVATAPQPGDVVLDLDLTTVLLPTASGAVDLVPAPPAAYPQPVVTRDPELEVLTGVTRGEALAAFTQFATGLLAVEGDADVDLPLLDATLTDVFSPGTALLELLTAQATARVVCGAANTLPPTGAPRPGQVRYCQAITDGLAPDGDNATWTSPDPGVTISGTAAGTVGTSPTRNVQVRGGGGFPRLVVDFAVGGEARQARTLLTSVQELGRTVDELGLGGTVGYRADVQALEVALRAEQSTRQSRVRTGRGGSLTALTGLAGLCPAEPGSTPRRCAAAGAGTGVDLDASGLRLEATFGLGLRAAQPLQAGDAAPQPPVSYLRPASDGTTWEIGALTAQLTGTAEMVGRIGFLQVDADLTQYALSTRSGGPAVTAAVAPGPVVLDGGTVQGALALSTLLGTDDAVTVQRLLTATADLSVTDSPGPGGDPRPLGGRTGTVQASWQDLTPDGLPAVSTGGDYALLRALDVVPSVLGTSGPASSGATLRDPAADFQAAFDVDPSAASDAPERLVERNLLDAAQGTAQGLCTEFRVDSATGLTCLVGPLLDDGFTPDSRYLVEGDPTALRDVLLEDLAAVLSVYATPDATRGFDRTLPLVDLRPDELAKARTALTDAVGTLIGLAAEADRPDGAPAPAAGDVSTLQGFRGALVAQVPAAQVALRLAAGALELDVDLTETSTALAPLRVSAGTRALRVLAPDAGGEALPVELSLRTRSRAAVELAVDLADTTSDVDAGGTSMTETVLGLRDPAAAAGDLAGKRAEYGAATATVGTASQVSAALGIAITTGPSGTGRVPVEGLRAAMAQQRTVEGTPGDCGITTAPAAVAGCLSLPLLADGAALTTVEVALGPDETSGGSGGDAQARPLALTFLADGLGASARTLRLALDGDQAGKPMPFVGNDLDGAADVPASIEEWAASARTALSGVTPAPGDTPASLRAALRAALESATAQGVSTVVTDVVLLCGAGACGASDTVQDVQEVQAPVVLTGTHSGDAPFATGLDGLGLQSAQTVPTTTTWTVEQTLGIARGTGPFLLDAGTLLSGAVQADLPDYDSTRCHSWSRAADWAGTKAVRAGVPASGASGAGCLDALVGKLPAVLVGRGGAPGGPLWSGLDAQFVVDLQPATGDRVFLPELFDRSVPYTSSLTGTGALDLYFEGFGSEVGFFDVVGLVGLTWSDGAFTGDVAFSELQLDLETVKRMLDVGYAKAKKYLEPFNPVVDVLTAELPGVSDLASLAGSPPVTLLSLLAKGPEAVRPVFKLLEFQQLIDGLTPGNPGDVELVDLGGGVPGAFSMGPLKIQRNTCTATVGATKAGGLQYSVEKKSKSTSGKCEESKLSKLKRKYKKQPPSDPTAGKPKAKTSSVSKHLSLPGVSVPVLADAQEVYDLLLGRGDPDLLVVDFGTAGLSKSITKNFGPFMLGPVPLVASIGVDVGLTAQFSFGFDTRALSVAIATLPTTGDARALQPVSREGVFADGFYINDLDAAGTDVAEVKLAVTVWAGASVSIGFASAGIKGGVVLDISLDAFDPNADGKVRTTEFIGAPANAGCAFDVSAGIAFFLSLYLRVDLFLITIDKSYDIVRTPRYVLFGVFCDLVEPQLAVPVDRAGGAAGEKDLLLTINEPGLRQGFADQVVEDYAVRQTGPTTGAGTPVQVTAFNIKQSFVVPSGGRVIARAGAGRDTVRLEPGTTVSTDPATPDVQQLTTHAFTVPALVATGADGGKVLTGDGPDVVTGGSGADDVSTRGGDDVVRAGGGSDSVDGGPGDDLVDGQGGPDRLRGGAGADEVRGGAGDDTVDGGTGVSAGTLFPTDDPARIGAMLDSGDVVVGGPGADTVLGGEGSDVVVGGDYAEPVTRGSTRAVTVFGTTQQGTLVNVDVSLPSIDPPTAAVADRECADPGAATSGGGDEVTGGPDADTVIGGGGPDVLSGGGGADRVCGRGGDDELDGDGSDVLPADAGNDVIEGGPGRDRMTGGFGNDVMRGGDGPDLLRGGDGNDVMRGGNGSDLLLGENGRDDLLDEGTGATDSGSGRSIVCAATTSIVLGLVDLDGDLVGTTLDDGALEGREVVDGRVRDSDGTPLNGMLRGVVVGDGRLDLDGNPSTQDTGVVALAGITGAVGDGDCLLGGPGDDTRLAGGAGGDLLHGGDGNEPALLGGAGDDLVRGGSGDDVLRGEDGNDLLVGGPGTDVLTGQDGADVLRGGGGDDLLTGGSATANAPDGPDELLGDGGNDVLAGGNALLSRTPLPGTAVPGRGVTLLATPQGTGPDDQLYGGYGDDWAFGQTGDDLVAGGPGSDVVEGGPGIDAVRGDDGADLVVGGSSTDGAVTLTRSGAGLPDGADVLRGDGGVDGGVFGGDGDDVLAGDNARLQPGAVPVLFDLGTAGAADEMHGDGGHDVLLGQGGADELHGGPGDDLLEGMGGADDLFGDTGSDALVGGGSTDDGVLDDDRRGDGLADGVDELHGGPGDDVLAGDNARLVRAADGALRTDGTLRRTVLLFDVQTSTGPVVGAGDVLLGGPDRDLLFGQAGNDRLHGGDGDDVAEGGPGEDVVIGGGDADDLLGGSSSRTGEVIGATDRLLTPPSGLVDASAAGVLDGADQLFGDAGPGEAPGDEGTAFEGSDVLLGDNGRITRRPGDLLAMPTTGLQAVRTVAMADTAPGATSGSDRLEGGGGDDALYGQFDATGRGGGTETVGDEPVPGDLLLGQAGDDVLVGDQGVETPTEAEDLGPETVLETNGGFVQERVLVAGSLVRVVELVQPDAGGQDVLLGGAGDDSLHGGAGDDLADGGAGQDVLFGADGADALWGGTEHDRIFGGAGADALDVKVRPSDPALWSAVAPLVDRDGDPATVNGQDLVYGGSGPDSLQADMGEAGPVPGDRLLDWTGVYNAYFVCGGAYGAGRVQNKHDPRTQEVLVELARTSGAVAPGTAGSSGAIELAMVVRGENKPKHPDAPGNFTCEGGEAGDGGGTDPGDGTEGPGKGNGKAKGKSK